MHTLIIGGTESGKTTLAKRIVGAAKNEGLLSIVYDPLANTDWGAEYQTDNEELFLRCVWASRNCLIFCDEAGETVQRYNPDMAKIFTRGRHYGHSCFALAQKSTQINPLVRDQCGAVYLFGCGLPTAKTLAEECIEPELLRPAENGWVRGKYIYKRRFGECLEGAIF